MKRGRRRRSWRAARRSLAALARLAPVTCVSGQTSACSSALETAPGRRFSRWRRRPKLLGDRATTSPPRRSCRVSSSKRNSPKRTFTVCPFGLAGESGADLDLRIEQRLTITQDVVLVGSGILGVVVDRVRPLERQLEPALEFAGLPVAHGGFARALVVEWILLRGLPGLDRRSVRLEVRDLQGHVLRAVVLELPRHGVLPWDGHPQACLRSPAVDDAFSVLVLGDDLH